MLSRWRRLVEEQPLGVLLWVSFLLKCFVIVFEGSHYTLNSDDVAYVQTARLWLQTGTFTYNDPSQPTLFITPGYPAFLAGMMLLFGSGALFGTAVRITQAGLLTLSFWLLYRIGLRITGKRSALGAALLCAFSPPLWLVANLLLTEALFVPVLLVLVYCALRLLERPGAIWATGFGAAWAAGVYIRPTVALWPGIVFVLLLVWHYVHWRKIVLAGLVAGLVFGAAMAPWWMRNYRVVGTFVPLTQGGGNPLLLGTFPFIPPSLKEQRTWHHSNDLRLNDRMDSEWAKQRIRDGFRKQPLLYAAWYTVGKFAFFWGDVYYWVSLAGLPLVVPIIYHYAILIPGFIGVWRWRHKREALLILSLFAYTTLLYMVYLAHSRYAVPFMPLLSLFAASVLLRETPAASTDGRTDDGRKQRLIAKRQPAAQSSGRES